MVDDVEAVDEFLAKAEKVLDGYQPAWTSNRGYRSCQLAWPILEEDTGQIRGHLRISVPEFNPDYPSMSLIFRGKAVCRLDLAAATICKPSPAWTWRLGLPSSVCGNHIHSWKDNRDHIQRSGLWELPARRPIEEKIDGLNQMFFWFCEHINVRVENHNTPITPPDAGLWSGKC